MLALLHLCVSLVPPTERQALVDLYEATGGASWRNSTGWLSGDPCDGWFGIYCDSAKAHVIEVFPNPRFSGNTLIGTIPGSFWDLTELEHIYLSNDRPGWSILQGSLPAAIGSLHKLKCLYTSHAGNLSGPLPAEISGLDQMQGLYLRWNSWTGKLPDLSRMRGLTKLIIDASPIDDCARGWCQSAFSGTLDALAAANLPLKHLDVAGNSFTGKFPEALCAIPECDAFGNHFEGGLPAGCCKNVKRDTTALPGPRNGNDCHPHDFPG
jgi:hypothetical protein